MAKEKNIKEISIKAKSVQRSKKNVKDKGKFCDKKLNILIQTIKYVIFAFLFIYLNLILANIITIPLDRIYQSDFGSFICADEHSYIVSYPILIGRFLQLASISICWILWKYIKHLVNKERFIITNSFVNRLLKFKFMKICILYFVSLMICTGLLFSAQYILKSTADITFCRILSSRDCGDGLMKPIIYIYPTETTDVSVKLGAPEKLSHTYPKYVDEWQVRAEPSGDLTDASGRHYYSLYWEGKDAELLQYDNGFVVAKDDVVSFLEEKLAQLGLNEREANEFIIYWLPKLESAPYTFIHFVSPEEQNKNMPLSVQPQPDTVIRVLMAFKSLDKPIEVSDQILPATPQRNGFTVIEWGGTEIGSGAIK